MNASVADATTLNRGAAYEALEARRAWRAKEHISPHSWVLISCLGDLAMALLAAVAAYLLRFHSVIKDIGNFNVMAFHQYVSHMALGSLLLVLALGWHGHLPPERAAAPAAGWLLQASPRPCCCGRRASWPSRWRLKLQPPISRVYVMLNGATALLLLLGWRMLFLHFLRTPGRVEALRQRALFVGWNEEALSLWKTLKRDHACAYEILGWVKTTGGDDLRPQEETFPCLGSLDEVEHLVATHATDMVVVADLHGPREQMVALANLCEREMIQFKVIPSCFRVFVSGLTLETIAGTPVLGVTRLPLDGTLNVIAKRTLDILGATVGLLVSAPIVALFSAIVWLESRGPVFYRQRRWGVNGVPFDIIKIRSMKLNAEQASGAQWCVKDDPRRLRDGRFHAPVEHRRAAAVLERAEGGDEPRRSASRAPGAHRRLQAPDPPLQRPSSFQARHDRLGAGERPAW
jgi:hypothetical protein